MAKIDLNLSKDILTESNCWHRRFFRCWIDGSYNGEAHYKANCHLARENYNDDKALRRHVISEWCQYMAAEFDCAPGTVMKHMVAFFSKEELEALNAELVDDLRDLVRDDMEVKNGTE
jgi:hypothetical protein